MSATDTQSTICGPSTRCADATFHGGRLRTRWAAIGAAIAVSLGGGVAVTHAAIGTGPRPVFIAITPCRLLDSRPAPDNVGSRSTPIDPGEVHVQQVTGSNGNCTGIPSDATAVALNVTSLNASSPSNLSVYPADAPSPPLSSNLNYFAGQAPTPNKVDVKLSATGTIALRNAAGTVDVIVDVVGYYVDHNHDDQYNVEVVGSTGGVDRLTGFTFVRESMALSTQFTTTKDGHLDVQLFVSNMPLLCTGGAVSNIAFLVVDPGPSEIPIENSAWYRLTDAGTITAQLRGVTTQVIPAGAHTVGVGVECLGANTVNGIGNDPNSSQLVVAVLPG
jgi:hypothetical protein